MFGPELAKKRKAIDALEAEWVDIAETVTPNVLHAIVRRYTDHLDEDRGAGRDQDDLDARALYLSKSLGGRWDVRGTLDPITGEVIAAALHAEMARDLQ